MVIYKGGRCKNKTRKNPKTGECETAAQRLARTRKKCRVGERRHGTECVPRGLMSIVKTTQQACKKSRYYLVCSLQRGKSPPPSLPFDPVDISLVVHQEPPGDEYEDKTRFSIYFSADGGQMAFVPSYKKTDFKTIFITKPTVAELCEEINTYCINYQDYVVKSAFLSKHTL
jgi:hypothetical protein